jgi:hypothetical protein
VRRLQKKTIDRIFQQECPHKHKESKEQDYKYGEILKEGQKKTIDRIFQEECPHKHKESKEQDYKYGEIHQEETTEGRVSES